MKRAVRNRVYTNKTHLRGFENLDLTLVRTGGRRACVAAISNGQVLLHIWDAPAYLSISSQIPHLLICINHVLNRQNID
ncbi:hypothetical protein LC605_04140 [Nostoc sp. CHAB 5836]|uniref:hypothetical protein n=1 Tax=Nostoc sp. CHAB 5836 TaxID=2780404 RepID=UPI001E561D34|nr:hypothetical protein [Nostoc sp. CHAB 5836]MCC5614279.1 hypothetical protein [Nostoc sp. CHAB 5836]